MMTWQLWRSLTRGTRYTSVYEQFRLRRASGKERVPPMPGLRLLKNAFMILAPLATFLMVPFLMVMYIVIMPLLSIMLPLAYTIYGLLQCTSVSAQLAQEHEHGTYDLLSVSPSGRLGLHWTYAVNWISQHSALRMALWFVIALGILTSLLGFTRMSAFPSPAAPGSSNTIWLWNILISSALILIEYTQTILLSSLVAMLIAAYTQQAMIARVYAGGVFLALQILIFAIISVVNPLLVSAAGTLAGSQIAMMLIALLITYAIREGVLWMIWQKLVRTLSTSPSELDAILHGGL